MAGIYQPIFRATHRAGRYALERSREPGCYHYNPASDHCYPRAASSHTAGSPAEVRTATTAPALLPHPRRPLSPKWLSLFDLFVELEQRHRHCVRSPMQGASPSAARAWKPWYHPPLPTVLGWTGPAVEGGGRDRSGSLATATEMQPVGSRPQLRPSPVTSLLLSFRLVAGPWAADLLSGPGSLPDKNRAS